MRTQTSLEIDDQGRSLQLATQQLMQRNEDLPWGRGVVELVAVWALAICIWGFVIYCTLTYFGD